MSDEEVMRAVVNRVAEALTRQMRGIVPERLYPPEEAAELLGYRNDRGPKTIREYPPEILPAVPITPEGKKVGYYGRDLIRFIRERRPKTAPKLEDVA